MKKQGFTLIELLAVIVIMGILMFAAIPAINRTIENARKDQFVNVAKNYARAAETLWNADGLKCLDGNGNELVASALPANTYYIKINTRNGSSVDLLQQGGKSPWGNKDVTGIVTIDKLNNETIEVYVALYDGTHLIGDDGYSTLYPYLDRSSIEVTSTGYDFTGDFYSSNSYLCHEI